MIEITRLRKDSFFEVGRSLTIRRTISVGGKYTPFLHVWDTYSVISYSNALFVRFAFSVPYQEIMGTMWRIPTEGVIILNILERDIE